MAVSFSSCSNAAIFLPEPAINWSIADSIGMKAISQTGLYMENSDARSLHPHPVIACIPFRILSSERSCLFS